MARPLLSMDSRAMALSAEQRELLFQFRAHLHSKGFAGGHQPRGGQPVVAPPGLTGRRRCVRGCSPHPQSRGFRWGRRSCRYPPSPARSKAVWRWRRRCCRGRPILSTRGTLSVPKASAAMACAPPSFTIRDTPAIFAAARITVGHVALRVGRGGHHDIGNTRDFGGERVHQNRTGGSAPCHREHTAPQI